MTPLQTQPSSDAIQIAVVGGGICGLTCAVALMRAGAQIEVYEAAAQFAEIGAGLGVGVNATRVLHELGLLQDILSRGDSFQKQWFQFHSGFTGHEVMCELTLREGEYPFMVHRAAFLDALVRRVDLTRVHFNKRCIKVSETTNGSKVVVHFADGSTALADVVIGADGIKSAVRGAVTETNPSTSVKFSHTSCYRGLVPIEAVRAAGVKTDLTSRPICFTGPGRHLIIFGINGGKLVNVVAFTLNTQKTPDNWHLLPPLTEPPVVDVTQDQVLKEYEGWGSDVLGLLGCIRQPSKWNINVVYPPLESYVCRRVALIGDAAHAMLPHLGAGAGQGLEDAYLISKLLTHPQTTLENLETVLQVYDEVRRPRAQQVWDTSFEAGKIYDGLGENGPSPEGLGKDLSGLWDYTWEHEANDDVIQAERRLRELGAFAGPRL